MTTTPQAPTLKSVIVHDLNQGVTIATSITDDNGVQTLFGLLPGSANLRFDIANVPAASKSVMVAIHDAAGKALGEIPQGTLPYAWPGRLKVAPTMPLGTYSASFTFCSDYNGRVPLAGVAPLTASFAIAAKPMMPVPQSSVAVGQLRPLHLDEKLVPEIASANSRWSINWHFGDGSQDRPGFNAAHVYEKPGTYPARVTWVDDAGKPGERDITVTVGPRDTVEAGTLAALQAALLAGGKTVEYTGGPLTLTGPIECGSRGDWCLQLNSTPVNGTGTGLWPMLMLGAGCTLLGGIFDNPAYDAAAKNPQYGMPFAIRAAAGNAAVIGSRYRNVSDFINGNNAPAGVLVQAVQGLVLAGLRGYFCWVEGSNWSVYDSYAMDSWYQHIVRCGGVDKIALHNNNFANRDLTAQGYATDIAKGNIVFHLRGKATIAANQVFGGPIGIGALGGADGAKKPDAPNLLTGPARLTDNILRDGSWIVIEHSSRDVFIDGTDGEIGSAKPLISIGGEDRRDYYWDHLAGKWVSATSANTTTFNYRKADGTYRNVNGVVLGPQKRLVNGGGSLVSVSASAANVTQPPQGYSRAA